MSRWVLDTRHEMFMIDTSVIQTGVDDMVEAAGVRVMMEKHMACHRRLPFILHTESFHVGLTTRWTQPLKRL